MVSPAVDDNGPIVVGIMYPPEWFGPAEAFAAELEEIRAIDPRIEVRTVAYVEPHELRTARGAPGGAAAATGIDAPQLSEEELDALGTLNVAVALDLPPDITGIAPGLRWVQAVGSGTAHLQALGLERCGVVLTSNGGSNSVGIAEFVVGRLIEFAKRFPAIAAASAEHRWEALYGRQLHGQTIGLIGLGSINRAVAVRARAFGMTVLATRRTPTDDPAVDELYGTDRLHEMLGRCDAVVAAVPETPDTLDLMDSAAFAAMRRGSFFVNVGRGTLVDEPALMEALESGHLAGAALDVTKVEPLPPQDPLWDAPNLSISSHCSTSPAALMPNLHRVFRENLERFVTGEPLLNQVTGTGGY